MEKALANSGKGLFACSSKVEEPEFAFLVELPRFIAKDQTVSTELLALKVCFAFVRSLAK